MTFGARRAAGRGGIRCGMLARLSHTRLLRYAGLFTWAVVGLPLVYSWFGAAAWHRRR